MDTTHLRLRVAVISTAIALAAQALLAGPAMAQRLAGDTGPQQWSSPMQAGALVALGSNPRAYAYASRPRGSVAPVARWNPCGGPIGYRVNLAHAPGGAMADVRGAIARLGSATGLRFVYRGTTRIMPGRSWQPPYPADTGIVIGWDRPSRNKLLGSIHSLGRGITTVGVGGSFWVSGYVDRAGRPALEIVEGFALLSSTARMTPGFGRGSASGLQGTRGQLLMHELGHAVGLDHPRVADRTEIMSPVLSRKLARWGAGDRIALRRVGAASGCLRAR